MLVPFKKAAPTTPEESPVADRPVRKRSGAGRRAAALVLLLAATAASVWWLRRREDGVRYLTAAATEGPLIARVTANGTISARVTVQVGSQVSGRIQQILVDFNSTVKRGDVLALLDSALFRATLAQARADLTASIGNGAKARARARNAAKVLERAKTLVSRDLIAGADVDAAEADADAAAGDVASAEGDIAKARAALHQAEVNLDYTTIVSPVDGTVISRNVDVGQTVAASLQAPTLFTIAEDLHAMQVHTSVPEADIGKLKAGMKASFTVDAFPDEKWKGAVLEIRNASQINQNVVTYDAVVDVENRSLRLRPGMTATVSFVYAERERATSVPNAALRYKPKRPEGEGADSGLRPRDGQRQLYILVNGSLQRRLVKLGVSDGKATEIVEGDITAGDQIVIDDKGDDAKRDGARRLPSKI